MNMDQHYQERMQEKLDQLKEANQPEPIRSDGAGAIDLGPRSIARDRLNPDILVPPATDFGLSVLNLPDEFLDNLNKESQPIVKHKGFEFPPAKNTPQNVKYFKNFDYKKEEINPGTSDITHKSGI